MTKRNFLTVFLLLTMVLYGKTQDTTQNRLNTVKINLLHSVLYSNALTLSYERIVKPNQSWSVSLGYVQFPKLGDTKSGVKVKNENIHNGFNVGGEYRFYLAKENKFKAPRGVYIGPFTNYFLFHNERTLGSADGLTEGILKSDINILNIGFQMGYQFVFHDRWTIDMVFLGPSVSRYAMKLDLSGNLNGEGQLQNEIVEALANRFPLVKELVDNQSATVHGTSSSWGKGFRYQLNVGYRFGKKAQKK